MAAGQRCVSRPSQSRLATQPAYTPSARRDAAARAPPRAAAQQLWRAPGVGEHGRMGAWPNHLVWVRVKGDDHDRQPKLAGHLDSASHDPLMAAMHAVELTKGDDGPAPLGWHVIKAVPPLHVRISLAVVLGHRAVPQACHGARPADTSGPARRAGIRAAGEYGQ